jgi:putative aldouronate transport system substrate-binding protein
MKRHLLSVITAAALCILLPSCAGTNGETTTTAAAISTSAATASTEIAEKTETAVSTSNGVIYSEERENLLPQNFPTYEEVQAQYPDKTVIVWAIEEVMRDRGYPFRTREINEYLNQAGYDFVVYFKNISTNMIPDPNLIADPDFDLSDSGKGFYMANIEEMLQAGENIDIMYTSLTYAEEGGESAYSKFVSRNLFEPLDNYLQSGIGKELYDLMPAKYWEGVRANGHIYGVDGTMNMLFGGQDGYYVNAELAEKYDYDISQPIENQMDILQKIKENENCDVISVAFDLSTIPQTADAHWITNAMYFDQSDLAAKCILDNEVFLDKLRQINRFDDLGLVIEIPNSKSKSFFIQYTSIINGSTLYKSHETIDIAFFDNMINVIPVFTGKHTVHTTKSATGICSQSKNKDKAFELLALTQTDPYLNNLLVYGLEGVDYNLVDGRVDNIVNQKNVGRFANQMICHRSDRVKLTPEDYTAIFDNAEVPEGLGFVFDGRNLIDETHATMNDIQNYIFIGREDFDAAIQTLREKLEANGINKMIEECNRQYQAYAEGLGT